MSRAARCGGGRPALTLVEVIVSLGLAVILLVALNRLSMQAFSTHAMLSENAAARRRQQLPLTLLEQDLAQLVTANSLELRDGALTLHTGNAMQSERIAPRHAVAVRYETAASAGDTRCLLRREYETGTPTRGEAGVTVACGLRNIEFAIFDGQSWQHRWPAQVPRPAGAVRLTLVWPDGDSVQKVMPLGALPWRQGNE